MLAPSGAGRAAVWRRLAGAAARSTRPAPFRGSRSLCSATAASNRVAPEELLVVAKRAAQLGAEIVIEALGKPRSISRKEGTDIVTETDKASESAVVAAIAAAFPLHAILGEEGGVLGDVGSEYLWCVDPLDGTVNFAHGYQSFCVSVGQAGSGRRVGVLRHATPVAGCVVEFIGGPSPESWRTRTFTAARNCGAFVDGQQITVSRVKRLEDALVVGAAGG
ncbi:Phosphatase IMPL1, chloroplastic [Tetrabaena socialis]|uniref:Phosphatase IMPL1, chloroplastic n=1 Tax=Tetrabaena socialis TaxID=47790 RepID=A0A2J8AAX4_9CHLO|nr:Phosphatase IMPL1, chloroplastic [Tetrabaena socialis]|eukprot:PNH09668.1 Phosphatase IMPL1, chloroplastic [Tetrabaena socialis]